VPLSNFVAWLATSLILVMVLSRIMGHGKLMGRRERRHYNFIPMALYLMNLVMFALVNLTHAYYFAGGLGITMAGLLIFLLLKKNTPTLPPFNWRNPLAAVLSDSEELGPQ